MRWVPAGLVAALLALPVNAAPTDPAPKGPARTIDELVADLAAPLFRVRESAQRDLWLRGDAAIPALERAASGDDPEAARRARELLDKFAWGVRPDTPADVLKLVRQFQAGDPNPGRADAARKEAVAELLKKGRPGASVVSAILRKDLPAESREKLAAAVTATVRRAVPLLLVAGKTEEANELVDLHATGTTPEGAADFAAYHALRGDLPAAIARAEALARTGRKGADAKLVLTYLYRAAGMWAKARAAAVDLSDLPEEATYREVLLEDEGNWAALADAAPGRELNHPEAVRLTLLRLAGRADTFAAAAKKLRADADELTADADLMDAAVALLANHRADAATDLLLEKKTHLGLLSEILIARMRYTAALDLIGTGKKEKETVSAAERLDFNLRRARVLMMTGHTDDAIQVFNSVAGGLNERQLPAAGQPLVFSPSARALIRTELRVGLRDLACEHAAQFVVDGHVVTGSAGGESPFELLFPHDPVAGQTLFTALRAAKGPGDAPGTTMIRTRDLLAGTAGATAVERAVGLLREAAGALPSDEPRAGLGPDLEHHPIRTTPEGAPLPGAGDGVPGRKARGTPRPRTSGPRS
ncbi:hypothetical protein [Frigoriglobus tundricola]|uniref:Uncharacterized protein n=1 Tax=Frigoriglobus tundricola TaxID=2774151 RepID=A0A6M5YKG9_9BACT|nr:hypothetical protein [Frigoriglobus tundricola]QJW94468.1 hypothetical protein FTUN_1988 [Frigoriglobus tundricola]